MKNGQEKIKIKQIASSIRCNKKQCLYLRALGMRKIGNEKELFANNSVLSLIAKVSHLIKIL